MDHFFSISEGAIILNGHYMSSLPLFNSHKNLHAEGVSETELLQLSQLKDWFDLFLRNQVS